MVWLRIILAMVALTGPAFAQGPGLMWNRTGLPLVFPLELQTDPGQDYFLLLRDAETGEEALAAYAVGGSAFRVLVPPGTFTLAIAAGVDWQDEEALFGADTRTLQLEEPLTFRITGVATKAGHTVDLRGSDDLAVAEVRDQALCQSLTTEWVEPRRAPDLPWVQDDRWTRHWPGRPDPLLLRPWSGGTERPIYDPRRGEMRRTTRTQPCD